MGAGASSIGGAVNAFTGSKFLGKQKDRILFRCHLRVVKNCTQAASSEPKTLGGSEHLDEVIILTSHPSLYYASYYVCGL